MDQRRAMEQELVSISVQIYVRKSIGIKDNCIAYVFQADSDSDSNEGRYCNDIAYQQNIVDKWNVRKENG